MLEDPADGRGSLDYRCYGDGYFGILGLMLCQELERLRGYFGITRPYALSRA